MAVMFEATRHLVCPVLTLALVACTRRSPDLQQPSAREQPNAGMTPPAAASSAAKPLPAPVTPKTPPEHVACGDRAFYRLTRSALQVFEIAAVLPPPQIRGSRIAVQTNEVTLGEPTNVFLTAKQQVVVLANEGVLHYEPGRKVARRYAPIAASAALEAWPDPRRADSFWVHAAGEDKLREYSLAGLPSTDGDAAPAPAPAARHVESLPEFDARLFTLLADRTPLYSTPKGLVRKGATSSPAPLPELPGAATALFADASPGRYWVGGASGGVALWDLAQGGSPVFSATVPGVVIDSARDGDRVAVLSLVLAAQGYVPTVTIFANGKELGRVDTGPSGRQQPELDVCLVTGRPWVVVGSRRWLQLIDWESSRLLAEW
jgi:hypothetical protein